MVVSHVCPSETVLLYFICISGRHDDVNHLHPGKSAVSKVVFSKRGKIIMSDLFPLPVRTNSVNKHR